MAILKRKTDSGWETVAAADEFPTPVPVQITEIDADLVPLSVTENGTYLPEAPHNGFSQVDVDVPTVDDTVYTATKSATRSASISFTGLGGNPREWWVTCANFSADSYSYRYVSGAVKSDDGADVFVTYGSYSTYSCLVVNSNPTYSNGTLTLPSGGSTNYYRAGTTYTLHYKL